MSEGKMNEIIKSSLEGIKEFTGVDTVFGKPITTPTGVTIIPVSKVSVGFAGAGLDLNVKKITSAPGFGGGSGTGVSITPVAFLTVSDNASINLIEIGKDSSDSLNRALNVIENSPAILEKIKKTFSD